MIGVIIIARSRGGGTSSFTAWPKVSHEYTGLRPLRFPVSLTSKKLGYDVCAVRWGTSRSTTVPYLPGTGGTLGSCSLVLFNHEAAVQYLL
eukprot:scaffold1880_cov128-Skeletonema_menzelii.AAC.7